MRIERHPIGVWVREDGCVFLPQSGKHPAHWTFGSVGVKGYMRVHINGKDHRVHRLVAETFIHNPENKPEVDHIDRNPVNNRVDNLRWATRSENNRNTRSNDRVESRGGTHSYEDLQAFASEKNSRLYALNRDKILKNKSQSYKNRTKSQKFVRLSDGSSRWLPNEQAAELLKLPVKERIL